MVLVMQPLYNIVQDEVLVNRHKLLEYTLLVTTGVVYRRKKQPVHVCWSWCGTAPQRKGLPVLTQRQA